MPYLGIFGEEFLKTIVIFEMSTLEFASPQNFPKKQKYLIWDQTCLIWVFLGKNFKKLLPYLKSAASNLPYCKIYKARKIPKFVTKMPYLGIFRLKFKNNIIKFELRTQNLSNDKISRKSKNA